MLLLLLLPHSLRAGPSLLPRFTARLPYCFLAPVRICPVSPAQATGRSLPPTPPIAFHSSPEIQSPSLPCLPSLNWGAFLSQQTGRKSPLPLLPLLLLFLLMLQMLLPHRTKLLPLGPLRSGSPHTGGGVPALAFPPRKNKRFPNSFLSPSLSPSPLSLSMASSKPSSKGRPPPCSRSAQTALLEL